jgi:3-methyladenine DNA glycosylase Tag
MNFLERRIAKAEQTAGAVIKTYQQLLSTNNDARRLTAMAKQGARLDALAEQVANVHSAIFQQTLAATGANAGNKTSKAMVEQFCVVQWKRLLGEPGYRALLNRLGISHPAGRK